MKTRLLPILRLVLLGSTLALAACSSTDHSRPGVPTSGLVASDPVELALALRGAPYRYAGASPDGFDCSGLVHYVFDRHGVTLPRTTTELAHSGRWVPLDEVQPGDLVFFGQDPVHHVGLVVGSAPLTMVHASTSRGVIVTRVTESAYWLERLSFARRP
jgi:cell wall-associated NlpC family hydrolase